ncbi:MAG: type I restriction endonuclease subunit R [Anaerolineae bacterium]|nr:type I restriction endonuclease subunit R [Anaerolineae bacterium]MDW7990831.1 type I restriction endonuclease subunit R [Anaerolineae bacterium]
MTIGSERRAVQNPFIRYVQEAGWTYLPPDEAKRLRRGETGLLLHDVFVSQMVALNPGVVDLQRAEDLAGRLARVPPNIEGNLQAWEYLKGLKTIFLPEERRERNVRLLDPIHPEANSFHVTDEMTVQSGSRRVRLDVALFVNGIPILAVETKSAHRLDGMALALDQMRRYHQDAPEFFSLAQLYALTHLIQFLYAATWRLSPKDLFNWREEIAEIAGAQRAGPMPHPDFETLVKTFVAPSRILRVLTDYILFVRQDGELSKAVLRPHQMRAVERALARARQAIVGAQRAVPQRAVPRRGLIWHTQGSGKTYTMITLARRLIEDPFFQNPTVLMLVDRNELEQQLFANLEAVGFGNVIVARSKRHLRELLRQDQRGLIVSTIHKFEGMPAELCTRSNVFVLVDEAHRSTGGDLGNYLMGALPNAVYIGFTGTPIDRTAHGQGTFKVFGRDDPKGYLDKYSIRESIADGTTVPLHYALAPNELRVDRETLDREFLSLAELEGVSDIEDLNRVLDRAVTLRNMLKSPDRMRRIAQFVADHFREKIEPLGYKAFLVAVDREACCRYKEELDRLLPPEYSRVVISRSHNDPPEIRRHHLSEDEERRVREAFRKPGENPRILIVTEKLLTGFDAPILYCLYLDKPMRDHVLLQAIARVNRPYEDEKGQRKPAGFVLDFVGIFENLERALAFDSEDVAGVVYGIDVLQERFEKLMEEGQKQYLNLGAGLFGDKAVEAILEHFQDPQERDRFYRFFSELRDLYRILSPDPFLRPFLEDYQRLDEIYQLLRSTYEARSVVTLDFQRETARLVQKWTQAGIVREPSALYIVGVERLDLLAAEERPDIVKVFNLLREIAALVERHGQQQPYLISIGERAEAIAQAFRERQMTTQQTLEALLTGPVREIQEAEEARRQSDLDPETFAIFWLLHREGVKNAREVAGQLVSICTRYPHWMTSEEQERELRIEATGILLKGGLPLDQAPDLVDRLLRMLRREG